MDICSQDTTICLNSLLAYMILAVVPQPVNLVSDNAKCNEMISTIRTKLLGRASLVPDSHIVQPAIRRSSIYT